MRLQLWIVILNLGLSLIHRPLWASEAYVSDSFKITMRTERNNESKIIAMLSSGDPIEILDTQKDWSRIRFQNPEGEAKEGWVLTRFIMEREPWEGRARALEDENASLKGDLATLEQKCSKLSQGEQNLKEQHQAAEAAVKKLTIENETLKASQKVKWFVVGALVLFVGWMMGLITGRMQRKRKSSFYSFGS